METPEAPNSLYFLNPDNRDNFSDIEWDLDHANNIMYWTAEYVDRLWQKHPQILEELNWELTERGMEMAVEKQNMTWLIGLCKNAIRHSHEVARSILTMKPVDITKPDSDGITRGSMMDYYRGARSGQVPSQTSYIDKAGTIHKTTTHTYTAPTPHGCSTTRTRRGSGNVDVFEWNPYRGGANIDVFRHGPRCPFIYGE